MTESLITTTPKKAFLDFCRSHSLDSQKYDYNITEIITYFGENEQSKKKASRKDILNFENDEIFIKTSFISQEFKIHIHKKYNKKFNFKLFLEVDKDHIHVQATIYENITFNYYQGLEEDILQEIYKQMLEHDLLIDIRTFDLKDKIKKSCEDIKTNLCIVKDMVLEVARGAKQIDDKPDEIISHYKTLLEKKKSQKDFSHARRELSVIIEAGDLVSEYVKLVKGRDGKNLRNKILKRKICMPRYSFKVSNPKFTIKEDELSVKYYANIHGYVKEGKDQTLDIVNILNISKLNLKTSGSVEAELNKDIVINVNSAENFEDGIESGITVEAQEINLKGSVAACSTIKANTLTIGGMTHAKASIYAHTARIFGHKGYLESDIALIDTLERGVVRAKIAIIRNCINAKVIAEKVYIKNLSSTNDISFLNTCIVENCNGESNKFYCGIQKFKEQNQLCMEKTKALEDSNLEIKKIKVQLSKISEVFEDNKTGISKFLKTYNQMASEGRKIPKSFDHRINEVKALIARKKNLENILQKEKDQQQKLINQLENLNIPIFNAKIIFKNHTEYEFNRVNFKLSYPQKTFILNTLTLKDFKALSLNKEMINSEDTSQHFNYIKTLSLKDFDPFNENPQYIQFIEKGF